MAQWDKQTDCKHDRDFILLSCTAGDRPPYAWYCLCQCGFWLNFDPRYAGEHRTDKWKKIGVAYTLNAQPEFNKVIKRTAERDLDKMR